MKREEMLNLWVNWSKWSDHIWVHYQRPKQQNSFDNWSIYFLIWNQQLVLKSISVKNVSNGQDKKKEIISDKDRAFIRNNPTSDDSFFEIYSAWIHKKPFLALEARLMSLYFDTKQYNMCLKLGQRLYSELKKLDDKALLVEIQLTESKVSHQLWFITIFPTFRPIIHLAIYKIHEHHWRPPGPLQIQFTVHPEPKPTWTCNLVFYTLPRITIGKLLSGNIYGFYLF